MKNKKLCIAAVILIFLQLILTVSSVGNNIIILQSDKKELFDRQITITANSLITAVLWTIVLIALVVYLCKKYVKNIYVKLIISASLICRIMISIFERITLYSIEDKLHIGDEYTSIRDALGVYKDGAKSFYTNYAYVNKLIFTLFGENMYMSVLINIALFTMLGIVIVFVYQKINISKGIIITLTAIYFFMPYGVLYTATFFRESIIITAIGFSYVLFIKWIEKENYAYWLMAVLVSLAAVAMHSGAIVATAIYFICFILIDVENKKLSFNRYTFIIMAIVMIFCIMILSIPQINIIVFNRLNLGEDILKGVQNNYYNRMLEHGGSEYLTDMQLESVGDFILYMPARMVYFWLSPMVWSFRGVTDIVTFVFDSLVYLAYLVITLLYYVNNIFVEKLKNVSKKDKLLIDIGNSIIFGTGIMYAWGTCSAGSAIRHRLIVIGIMAIVAAKMLREIRIETDKED